MNISGTTRVFLILGDPVGQVRAPEVFNHLFDKHGADAVLVPAHVPPEEFAAFTRQAFKARNMNGLWLAIPHKTAMVKLLDHCDRLGRSAEAVNAVRRNADGTTEGALFDGVGFTKALDHFGIPIAGRRIRGAGHLALYDTAKARTEKIASRLGAEFGVSVVSVPAPDPAGYDLVVNATPLGLKAGDPLPFDVARLDAGTVVFDILMKNQPTPLLRACQARSIVAHPGFEMMVQQVPEYLSFFGYDSIAKAVQADPSDVRALFSTS